MHNINWKLWTNIGVKQGKIFRYLNEYICRCDSACAIKNETKSVCVTSARTIASYMRQRYMPSFVDIMAHLNRGWTIVYWGHRKHIWVNLGSKYSNHHRTEWVLKTPNANWQTFSECVNWEWHTVDGSSWRQTCASSAVQSVSVPNGSSWDLPQNPLTPWQPLTSSFHTTSSRTCRLFGQILRRTSKPK